MSLGEQATAAPAAGSTDRRHQHCCRQASLTPLAHSRRQAVTSRRSTCGASTQAARMRVGTVGQFQHAWKSLAAVLAHGASRPARCPFPRSRPSHSPRSTYAARSQPSGGVLTPDKVSSTLHDEDSMASAVSESDADMRRSDANPRLLPVSPAQAPYWTWRVKATPDLHVPRVHPQAAV